MWLDDGTTEQHTMWTRYLRVRNKIASQKKKNVDATKYRIDIEQNFEFSLKSKIYIDID